MSDTPSSGLAPLGGAKTFAYKMSAADGNTENKS